MSSQQQYEIKEREQTEATILVTVDSQTVQNKIQAIYRRYAREVRVPGFRPGRVPRNYLDTRFGREAFLAEAQDELKRDQLPEALDQLDLRPVSVPKIEIVSFGESDPFVFEAAFSVLPVVEPPDYRGIEITVPREKEVTDEDIERVVGQIGTRFSTLTDKAGDTVSDGDIVHVKEHDREWDARADGESPIMQALIGGSVGSTVAIDAELPEGGRLQTSWEIVGLREVVLPEIDDDLAKDAGFDGLEALRTDIRTTMTRERAAQHSRMVDRRLLDALVEKAEIPLPEAFIDHLVDDEVKRLRESLEDSPSGPSFAEYLEMRETDEEKLREDLRESISLRVRRELLLRKLAEAAGIVIDDDELGELATDDAREAGEDPLRFAARLKAEDRWDDYRSSKVNERVFALLRTAANVREEE